MSREMLSDVQHLYLRHSSFILAEACANPFIVPRTKRIDNLLANSHPREEPVARLFYKDSQPSLQVLTPMY
jgi:hypothetical protein